MRRSPEALCRRCTDLALLSLAHHFSSFYLSFSPQIHVLSSDQPIPAFRWDRGGIHNSSSAPPLFLELGSMPPGPGQTDRERLRSRRALGVGLGQGREGGDSRSDCLHRHHDVWSMGSLQVS
jgi:hypothetical protein